MWRAIAWPSRWRGVQHRSQPRREKEARVFFAHLTASTAGRPPCLTSDQLPASVAALIAHDSPPAPPPVTRGPGRPRQPSRRGLDPEWCEAQVDTRRAPGRIGEGRRSISVGTPEIITAILGSQPINTSAVERDHRTSPPSHGRCVRNTRSHSTNASDWPPPRDLEDAVCHGVRPHLSLRVAFPQPINRRRWPQRTPAMGAGLTDHMWTLEA